MEEQPSSPLEQLKTFYGGLSRPRKAILAFCTAGALILALLVATLGSQVEYAHLYSELSTEDASAITAKLDQLKVPYQLTHNGTGVEVPKEDLDSIRLQLASEGLPRGGGVGFELFDKQTFGATEFEQNVNLRRAMEGELSRSVSTIEGVQSARVHLVLPERRLFVDDRKEASASVVLKLDNPSAFQKREINATVHLVASAVPGLNSNRISVVSTEGTTLHRPDENGAGGSYGSSEKELAAARELERHVQSMLERVVGPGNAEVRANLQLSAAQTERTTEIYEPTTTSLRSEQRTEELAGREQATVAGVPGAATELGTSAIVSDEGLPDGVFRRSFTKNWEIDRVTEKTLIPAGEISKLGLSILVNHRQIGDAKAAKFEPRTVKELEQIEALAKSAAGFDEERGDLFSIETARFAPLVTDLDATAPTAPKETIPQKYLMVAAAGLLLLLLAIAVLVAFRKKKKAEDEQEIHAPSTVEALLGKETPTDKQLEEGGEDSPTLQLAGMTSMESEALHARAADLANRDPATAALVLRQWIGSDPVETAPQEPQG